MTKPRFRAAVAASAVLLTALAGCAGEAETNGAEQPNASATSNGATPETPTEAPEPEATGALNKDNFVGTLVEAMQAKKTAHMEMEVGSTMSASADIRYGGGDALSSTEMAMTLTMGSMETRMIIADGAVYMGQPGSDKFMKISADDPTFGSMLDQVGSIGPEASVKAMEGGIQSVEAKGTEKVDGLELHRYLVTIDSSKVAGALGGLGSTVADSGAVPDKLAYDMWLDSDNLMRQFKMDVLGQKVTMKISRWGEPVEVKAPPASQIIK